MLAHLKGEIHIINELSIHEVLFPISALKLECRVILAHLRGLIEWKSLQRSGIRTLDSMELFRTKSNAIHSSQL